MERDAATLFAALDRFVAGGTELARLYEDFYWPYFNDIDPDSLGTREADLLDAVAERMDLTDDRPDTDSRSHGWQSTAEFRTWLAGQLSAFRTF